MTHDELVARLERIRDEEGNDFEVAHDRVDAALLEFIGDARVAALHAELAKWFA